LVALYFGVLRHHPRNPYWPERDRLILSKGHATPACYAVLAEAGYFPREELPTFRQLGRRLQGHTIMGNPPGVEMSAGSLGLGLSFGLGQALAARLNGRFSRIYCRLSEWEAATACAHHRGDNLSGIVDYNHIHNDGFSG
jgi:transketolase